jgi:hypothetical protein
VLARDSAFRQFKVVAISVLFFSLIGPHIAIAQDVRYDFDNDTDFSKFRTYKWVPIQGADEADTISTKQLIAAVDAQLSNKGLSRTDAETADLYVGYQTAIRSEKKYSGWKFGPGWGKQWYGGYAPGEPYRLSSNISVGQLDLSIYDSERKELVWRGSASKTVDPKAPPDKKLDNINKAVEKFFKNYPPKPN